MAFIKIKPFRKKEVEINTAHIKELAAHKIGHFIALFDDNPANDIIDHGKDGTKIKMIDGTAYNVEESIESIKNRIEKAEQS